MTPFSWPVLVGAAVVASPALWAAGVAGTLSPDVALVRVVLCILGIWAALSVIGSLAAGAQLNMEADRTRVAQEALEADLAETEMQRPADVDLG